MSLLGISQCFKSEGIMEKTALPEERKIHFANKGGKQGFQVKVAKWTKKLK